MNKRYWLVILFITACMAACEKAETISAFIGFTQPANFPLPAYNTADNAITAAGFELGRKLFYDPRLSGNNTISCGSCHIQTAAFTHHGHSVSHGINDRLGTRNSPPIMNLAWSTSFMWDGGVADLDLQPIAPITSHVEMDETVDHALGKLNADPQYKKLFADAYGPGEITGTRFFKALSQFMRMCISSHSKYDSVTRHEGNAVFSPAEAQGYALFKQKCNACHKEPLFTDFSFRNNGLNPSVINDEGRYAVTLDPADRYKFKVPGLRNLGFTPPYMHDGRFLDLGAVLDHYNGHVAHTANLDPLLSQGGIPLTANEKENILAFLKTLDDIVFVTDRRFSE